MASVFEVLVIVRGHRGGGTGSTSGEVGTEIRRRLRLEGDRGGSISTHRKLVVGVLTDSGTIGVG